MLVVEEEDKVVVEKDDEVLVVVELEVSSNSSTRLLNLSDTHRLCPESNATAMGPRSPFWVVENVPVM